MQPGHTQGSSGSRGSEVQTFRLHREIYAGSGGRGLAAGGAGAGGGGVGGRGARPASAFVTGTSTDTRHGSLLLPRPRTRAETVEEKGGAGVSPDVTSDVADVFRDSLFGLMSVLKKDGGEGSSGPGAAATERAGERAQESLRVGPSERWAAAPGQGVERERQGVGMGERNRQREREKERGFSVGGGGRVGVDVSPYTQALNVARKRKEGGSRM